MIIQYNTKLVIRGDLLGNNFYNASDPQLGDCLVHVDTKEQAKQPSRYQLSVFGSFLPLLTWLEYLREDEALFTVSIKGLPQGISFPYQAGKTLTVLTPPLYSSKQPQTIKKKGKKQWIIQ
jgi:hypothetical protein